MSHLPLFKFFLMKDDSTYYRAPSSGGVTTTTVPTPLVFAPDGWKDTELLWLRNTRYWGMFRSVSSRYKFVKDGASIMRYVYYTQGVEGYCKLVVQKRRDSDWVYEDFYVGSIDFSNTIDTDNFFSVNVLDGDLTAKLKANESVSYEIPCGPSANVTKFEGIQLYGKYFYAPAADTPLYDNRNMTYVETGSDGDYIVAKQTDAEGKFHGLVASYYVVGTTWTDYEYALVESLLKAYQAMSIRIRVKQNVLYSTSEYEVEDFTTYRIRVLVVSKEKKTILSQDIYVSPSLIKTASSSALLEIDVTSGWISVPEGAKVYVVPHHTDYTGTVYAYQFSWFGNDDLTSEELQNYLTIESRFVLPDSYARTKFYYELFDEVMKRVAGTTATVSYSNLLRSLAPRVDNIPGLTQVTCGDAIRNFDTAQIRTNLADLFKDASARWCAALGYDTSGRVVLEHISYFLDKDTVLYNLGEVSEMEISVANEYIYNTLKVGMATQDYDQLNGRDEYNQTVEFKLPFNNTKNSLDQISPYRWDMYGIETYRANLSKKKTTDSNSDNDTFVVSTQVDFFDYKVRKPPVGSFVDGVLSPSTAYNVDLSPKRNLLRNAPLLASCCHLRAAEKITFQTADKNNKLISRFGPGTVAAILPDCFEIGVSDLGTPAFYPIIFEFKTVVPTNMLSLMGLSPKGCFRFKYRGTTFKGFPMEVGYKPSNNDAYTFKLLSTPDNDLTKLF